MPPRRPVQRGEIDIQASKNPAGVRAEKSAPEDPSPPIP
jgi:hypothetical protein